MVMSLSRVLWKVHSKAPTVTASMLGTVLAAGEGYTTIRDSTGRFTVDVIVNATGFRPDLDMLREIRLGLDDIVEAGRVNLSV